MFQDTQIELQLLGWQLHNPVKLLSFGADKVGSLLTEPAHKELSKLLWQHYVRYKQAPTVDAITATMHHLNLDVTVRAGVLASLHEVASLEKPLPLLQCIEILDGLRLRREAHGILSKTVEELETKSGQDVVTNMMNRLADVRPIKDSEVIRHSWGGVAETRVRGDRYVETRDHPEKLVNVPWGIKALDDVTGGLRPSWLCVYFARPGVGKSRLLLNLAYNQARAGYLVQYFSYEMPYDMIEALLDSREALVDYNKILKGSLDVDAQETYRLSLRGIRERNDVLEVVDVPRGGTTGQIEQEMKLFAAKYGRVPDVIYVDHVGLVLPRRKVKDKYEAMGATVKDLHEIGRAFSVGVVSAMHEQRRKGRQQETGLENIYGTDEAGQHAELVAQIEQDAIDEARGMLRIKWVKNRYGATGVAADLVVDWATTYIGDNEVHLAPRPEGEEADGPAPDGS